MTSEEWERLKSVFDQALGLHSEERNAFVADVRHQDEDLAQNLENILNAGEGLFDRPLLDVHDIFEKDHVGAQIPAVFSDRFRIIRKVGVGGMGEVFEAEDLQLNDRVALKVIRREIATERVTERFKAEVLLGKRISHPNVCRIHDLGIERLENGFELPFLTMEFLDGVTLSTHLRLGPLDTDEVFHLLGDLASALGAAHQAGVVHRDFKSGNVILVPTLGRRKAVITDFGLAKAVETLSKNVGITKNGPVSGTVDYMAPELLLGSEIDAAVDIYALGVVAFEMVTGHLPFQGASDVSVAVQHLYREAPSPREYVPNLDVRLETAILTCLQKDPRKRFGSVASFEQALRSDVRVMGTRAFVKQIAREHQRWVVSITAVLFAFTAIIAIGPTAFKARRQEMSPTALKWYRKGTDAIYDGTYYTAINALEQSRKENGDNRLTDAKLAEAWLELNSPERANEEMLRAQIPPRKGSNLNTRDLRRLDGIHYTLTRDFEKAIGEYANLVKGSSEDDLPKAVLDLGRAQERAGHLDKALEQYQSAVRLDPTFAGGWLRLALLDGQLTNSEKMESSLQRAESLYRASTNLEGLTEVFFQRGKYAIQHLRIGEGAVWMERAHQLASATGNSYQKVRSLYQLTALAYQRGDPETAKQLAQAAINESKATDLEFLAGDGYLELGNTAQMRGNFEEAVQFYYEVRRIARLSHNEFLEATAKYYLGGLANRKYPDAAGVRQVEEALDWFSKNSRPNEVWNCRIALAKFLRDKGDLVGATLELKSLVQSAEGSHEPSRVVSALAPEASVFIQQERFPEALLVAQKWLATSLAMNDSLRVVAAQGILARIYGELGRFVESERATQSARLAARNGDVKESLVNVTVTQARTLLLAGRLSESAAIAASGIKTYYGKDDANVSELLGVRAMALEHEPLTNRLKLCQDALALTSGAMTSEPSLKLVEMQLRLEGKDYEGVLGLYPALRAAFERQTSEYSLYLTELAAAQASRNLRTDYRDALERSEAALLRLRQQFAPSDWEVFRKRRDFAKSELILFRLKRYQGQHSVGTLLPGKGSPHE